MGAGQYIRLILANMPTVITSVSPAQRLSRAFNHVGQNSMKITALGGSVLRGHQQGCFISTTRDYETARFFATRDNTCAGVIYHIDESLFSQYQVVAKEFPDPLYPDEWEVSVRSADCGPLPSEIIVRIEEVFPISRV
ncbi:MULTISPECIES: hypothetical protein [Burkholderia]|uniref:hypothetical protein n=1 Tax=Burkholderia TaxID=32008 RepID=UPI000F54536C|nr:MULTISPECIES: hypothetical protein [Burkholderia]RQM57300.1 hypothetical protein EHZ18_15230 [Burkholderia vietnamiensis]